MTYRTIQQDSQHELIIKKSRFITHLFRIDSEATAKAHIDAVKKAHYKANHNVSAYLLGDDDHIQRATDDGEPSGTAGVPMLTSLQQLGVHDVLAVTTRYFGGIKLGAGGLIRAYADSVVEAAHASVIVERVELRQVTLTIAYPQLDSVQHWLAEQGYDASNINYAENVTITTAIAAAEVKPACEALVDLLAGKIQIDLGEQVHGWQPAEPPD